MFQLVTETQKRVLNGIASGWPEVDVPKCEGTRPRRRPASLLPLFKGFHLKFLVNAGYHFPVRRNSLRTRKETEPRWVGLPTPHKLSKFSGLLVISFGTRVVP